MQKKNRNFPNFLEFSAKAIYFAKNEFFRNNSLRSLNIENKLILDKLLVCLCNLVNTVFLTLDLKNNKKVLILFFVEKLLLIMHQNCLILN